ncbi:MAG: type I methionyl aminopeptidase [Nitrospirae bacterium]|nr:type I methionyl aminopeptidase [Nitrospirota bacterium]
MSITIKNEEQIQAMREGGKILAEVLEKTCEKAIAGVSTLELDHFAENFIRGKRGIPGFKNYKGFPNTLCTCLNEKIVHGIPRKDEILKEGDLFTVDCGVIYKGMNTDAARTIAIGKISEEKQKLLSVAKETLAVATNTAKPGVHLNEIGKNIQKIVEKAGYHIIHDLTGHGIGKNLHEDPVVLNYWDGNPGPLLKQGMTLAIEPIFAIGTSQMRTLSDNWTLVTEDNSCSIQIENTILITQNGNEVLTKS